MKMLLMAFLVLMTGCGPRETPDYRSVRPKTEDGQDQKLLDMIEDRRSESEAEELSSSLTGSEDRSESDEKEQSEEERSSEEKEDREPKESGENSEDDRKASSDQAVAWPKKAVVYEIMNIRSGPGTDYEILFEAQPETEFEIEDEIDGWLMVRYEGYMGYMNREAFEGAGEIVE